MELDIIRWIQSFHHGFWDNFFTFITMLGEEVFLFLTLTYLYWNVDKSLGKYIAYSAITGINLNGVLKSIFNFPRPIGEEGIRTLRAETATGSSFPSGHTQGSASVLFSLSLWIRKRLFTIASVALVALVALSRLYLGVHYPKDVLAGGILGFLSSWVCLMLYQRFTNKSRLFFITFLLFCPFLLIAGGMDDFIKSLGLFGGLAAGNLTEEKYVNFQIPTRLLKKLLRWILGLVIILILKEGLKVLFPVLPIFSFLRYFLISFTTIGLYPLLLKKIRL